jgi:hypothetical protein
MNRGEELSRISATLDRKFDISVVMTALRQNFYLILGGLSESVILVLRSGEPCMKHAVQLGI